MYTIWLTKFISGNVSGNISNDQKIHLSIKLLDFVKVSIFKDLSF